MWANIPEKRGHHGDPNSHSTFPSQNLSVFSKEERDLEASPARGL